MNKEELQIAKAIAELEGVELYQSGDEPKYWRSDTKGSTMINGRMYSEYKPFEWQVLGPLMVKHEVTIDYDNCGVYITDPLADEWSSGILAECSYKDDEDIPRAILECILKANK